MKILKNYLFSRRYAATLKKGSHQHRFVTYDNAKTVFLLFEFDAEKYASFVSIIESLERDGKKVTTWAYCNEKVENTLDKRLYPKLNIFSKKSLKYSGKMQSDVLSCLQKNTFDVLIDLSLRSVLPLMYVVLYTKADCRVGTMKTKYNLFDFMIDTNVGAETGADKFSPFDEQSVFNQIIFYLKSIQTTD